MENRIDYVLSDEVKNQSLENLSSFRKGLPFLIKLSDSEKTTLQKMDDGRQPFTEKALEFAARATAINPGDELVAHAVRDLNLHKGLSSLETELKQLLEMVTDTKQLAGAEAYEVARFVYMKAKMAVKMKEPGMQAIVDELGKLYKQGHRSNDSSEAAAK
jgi:hypothetical protein